MLAEFEGATKADHAAMQAFGQKLVERHVAEVKSTLEAYHQAVMTQQAEMAAGWQKAFEADPEIGGNRKDTTVEAARQFIERHGGTGEQKTSLRQMFETTKVGNHPDLIRLLAKANLALSEGRPLAASRPVAAPKSNSQKLYGG